MGFISYLQSDDTSLAYLNDPRQREMSASMGGDAEQAAARRRDGRPGLGD